MNPRNLYILRYRQGTTGVQTSFITATSPTAAERTGQWWCNQQPNRKFIRAEPAVVADEADVPVEKPDDRRIPAPAQPDPAGVDTASTGAANEGTKAAAATSKK